MTVGEFLESHVWVRLLHTYRSLPSVETFGTFCLAGSYPCCLWFGSDYSIACMVYLLEAVSCCDLSILVDV